jgi:hypothetical protein
VKDGRLRWQAKSQFPIVGFSSSFFGLKRMDVMKVIDQKLQTELESAVLKRLIEHLRRHSEVQNIDLMNLAGFCRNCLANWYEDAAKARGIEVPRPQAREFIYGMPYEEWKAKHQRETTPEQKSKFEASHRDHE